MRPIMQIKDERYMTLLELANLASELPTLKVGSRKYKRARNMMAVSSAILEDALGKMLWWTGEVQPEAPPDAEALTEARAALMGGSNGSADAGKGAEVVEFYRPKEKMAPFLVL